MTKTERKIVAETLAAIHKYWTDAPSVLSPYALLTEEMGCPPFPKTIMDMVRTSAQVTGGSWAEEGNS